MSGSESIRVWVSDLDGYVSVGSEYPYDGSYEEENDVDPGEIGDVELFCGKRLSWKTLADKGITGSDWRWALHEATNSLSTRSRFCKIEKLYIKAIANLGKHHAIRKYSFWEGLPLMTAQAASWRPGLLALLHLYFEEQSLSLDREQKHWLVEVIKWAEQLPDLTAYDRVSEMRNSIYDYSKLVKGEQAASNLPKAETRRILSLLRLYFSVIEMRLDTFDQLRELLSRYEHARAETQRSDTGEPETRGKKNIKNWSLRHRHPLMFYFPYSLRQALLRGVQHSFKKTEIEEHTLFVNELALAKCQINLKAQRALLKSKR